MELTEEQKELIEKEFNNFLYELVVEKLKIDIDEDQQDDYLMEQETAELHKELENYLNFILKREEGFKKEIEQVVLLDKCVSCGNTKKGRVVLSKHQGYLGDCFFCYNCFTDEELKKIKEVQE